MSSSTKKNCVKKYVKCSKNKRCRVKTGNCVTKKPDQDVEYNIAGKKFYITPGQGHEKLLAEEYGVRRSSRIHKTPERMGVVTGDKYKRQMRRGIKIEEDELNKKEEDLMNKFKSLDLDLQNDLVNSSDDVFELTVTDLDKAAGFIFPEVPIGDISPTGFSPQDFKLLDRLRALALPLGNPPSPPKVMKGSRVRRIGDAKLDERRLKLFESSLFGDYDLEDE